jgi:hypothetical protein
MCLAGRFTHQAANNWPDLSVVTFRLVGNQIKGWAKGVVAIARFWRSPSKVRIMSIEKLIKSVRQELRPESIHGEPVVFGEPAMFWVDEARLHEYLMLELKRLQPER